MLAAELGYLLFDTGAMYRAVTWAALDRGVPVGDETAVTALAEKLQIDVRPPDRDDGRKYTVLADGADVTWVIRAADVDSNVSAVSAYPGVRAALVAQQRRIAAREPVVMIGRDIATVVLPDADLKVYLDASVTERSRRRWRELVERGEQAAWSDVLSSMRRRDAIDSNREVSPLAVACDAIVIDTTRMSVDEVMGRLRNLIRRHECTAA